jgi:peroxiredoxin
VKLFGVSLLETEWQREFVKRNTLSFRLLSDVPRGFSGRLGLPLFETGGVEYLQRLTIIAFDGTIRVLRYPVPEPERDAIDVLDICQALVSSG